LRVLWRGILLVGVLREIGFLVAIRDIGSLVLRRRIGGLDTILLCRRHELCRRSLLSLSNVNFMVGGGYEAVPGGTGTVVRETDLDVVGEGKHGEIVWCGAPFADFIGHVGCGPDS